MMPTIDPVQLGVLVVGGSGIVGGIIALFKVRPEVARVTVSAAEGAVIVQSSVITTLNNELKRLQVAEERCNDRVDELQRIIDAINERKNERRSDDPK